MRVQRIGILLLAGDAVLFGDILAGHPHVIAVVNVPEAVVDHTIDGDGVAHAKSLTCLGQQVGGVRHRLHATGDDDLGVSGLNCLGGESNGLQPRSANLVNGHSADLRRKAAEDGRLARRVLAFTRCHYVAHDAFIDQRGLDAGAAHYFADDHCAQLRRGKIGKRTHEFSDGSTNTGNDYDLFHATPR